MRGSACLLGAFICQSLPLAAPVPDPASVKCAGLQVIRLVGSAHSTSNFEDSTRRAQFQERMTAYAESCCCERPGQPPLERVRYGGPVPAGAAL